jgi:ATP-dependent Clp protease protease subunit
MIHQPSAGTQGMVTDMEISLREAQRLKNFSIQKMAEFTGRKEKEVFEAMERDNWMDANAAKKFGLIDGILTRK